MGGCPPRPQHGTQDSRKRPTKTCAPTTCCVQEASKRKTSCSMPSPLLCRNLKDSAHLKCAETWRFPHIFGRPLFRAFSGARLRVSDEGARLVNSRSGLRDKPALDADGAEARRFAARARTLRRVSPVLFQEEALKVRWHLLVPGSRLTPPEEPGNGRVQLLERRRRRGTAC